VGYPLWWILGVTEPVVFAAAILMALELLRHRPISVPRGFGWWLLFLLWVAVGLLLLQVNAPGAVEGPSNGRYLVWAYRLALYLSGTIVLLYICTMRKVFTAHRICRILAALFVTLVIGGVLGVLAPHLEFPSVLEALLPRRLTANAFVHSQVHPNLAEVYTYIDVTTARPSAPFPYANEWGYNFACFLPFFLRAWCGRDAGWRRIAAPVVLVLALVPVIYSLNRGLWFALIAMGVFVGIRAAVNGRIRFLGVMAAAIALAVPILLLSPLKDKLEARFTTQHSSNEGRSNLADLTVSSVSQGSPIVGFGTTRHVQGSFTSIAEGATADCPRCAPPSLGTQGQVWLIVFAEGLGGLVIYLGFFVLQLRHIRLKSTYATVALSVLLVQFFTLPVYDLSGPALFAVMIAIGLLWRESLVAAPGASSRWAQKRSVMAPTLGGYVGFAHSHRVLIAGFAVVGILAGGAWHYEHRGTVVSTVSTELPAEPDYPGDSSKATTLDTLAQYVSSPAVLAAVSKAVHHPVIASDDNLLVTASPNTRILTISYHDTNGVTANAGATAAADALIRLHAADLQARKTAALKVLQSRSAALTLSLTEIGQARKDRTAPTPAQASTELLNRTYYDLIASIGSTSRDIAQVNGAHLDAGDVVSPASASRPVDAWNVAVVTGMMIGLLVGILVSLFRDAIGIRLGNRSTITGLTGVPILETAAVRSLVRNVRNRPPGRSQPEPGRYTFVAPPGDPEASAVAGSLDAEASPEVRLPDAHQVGRTAAPADPSGGQIAAPALGRLPSVMIVVSAKTSTRTLRVLKSRLERSGNRIEGLVVLDRKSPRTTVWASRRLR
jgi:capsular polysaccharide biosynthesis protein